MAHLDSNGQLVPCGPSWASPSEVALILKRVTKFEDITLDDFLKKLDKPEWESRHRLLVKLSKRQLKKLDKICPRSIDLTMADIERVR